MSIICPKCNEKKEATDFRKCLSKKTGKQSYCKICQKIYLRENRNKRRMNGTYIVKYNPEKRKIKKERYKLKHQTKYKAGKKLGEAKSSGKIKALPCEICGDIKVEGHHDNYLKPLDVIWLCQKHHRWIHQ